ncbi:MAG TPA: sulfotransferase, partial [Xanthomonadaceae bacterium]|nr:sulfotransferase [Xanthomonadaceae bacterium]
CLRTLGDTAHALRWLDRLEKLSPGKPDSSAEYGNCLADGGNLAAAEPYWMRAIDLWIATGDLTAANLVITRLLECDPNSASGWNALGGLERTKHDFVAAETAWRRALDLEPGRLDASASLALLYESTNRVADARALAERAAQSIGSGCNQHGAIELLFVLGKTMRRTHDLEGALRTLDRIDLLAPNETQRMAASFERGKLLDLLDEPSGAMTAFATGNAIAGAQWHRHNPGRNRFLAGIDYMLDALGGDWMREWKRLDGPPDAGNVSFLIGFPRSGTTLLNQVLNTHPAIQAIEEKPPASKITAGLRAMPGGYPRALADLDALDVAWLREAYFRSAAEHGAPDRSRLVLDKFPMNIVLAGMLYRVFPPARFVLALRHPCDVVLSCFMQNFEINNTMANFCTLADTVALYTRTMDLWQVWRDALPLNVHTVRYEDVVEDFDGQVRRLCDFLGVPWRDDLRDFSAKALERGRINTPSYEQVSRPIYREAMYRWERYREHLEPF